MVIPDANGVTSAQLDHYAAALSRVPERVVGLGARRHVRRRRSVGPPSAAAAITNGSAFFTVTSSAPLYSQASQTQLDRLHAVPGPDGRHVLITGTAQVSRDTDRCHQRPGCPSCSASLPRSRLFCCSR